MNFRAVTINGGDFVKVLPTGGEAGVDIGGNVGSSVSNDGERSGSLGGTKNTIAGWRVTGGWAPTEFGFFVTRFFAGDQRCASGEQRNLIITIVLCIAAMRGPRDACGVGGAKIIDVNFSKGGTENN